QTLVEKLHAVSVIVGDNFRYGHKAAGDIALLQKLGESWGFTATAAPLLKEPSTGGTSGLRGSSGRAAVPFSATYIRTCVQAGDIRTAAEVLGRPHRLDGIVERGDQRGRELGFPTANLRTEQWAAVPADGVYAGRVFRLDEWGRTVDQLGIAAISVGTNPTFEVRQRRVEAFVLDFSGDLYGQALGVEFVERLRGMEKFDGIEPLIAQMNDDVKTTRELLIPW
ncbi:MAG TPA: riboflavin kinase, partial [Jatrophihabitans sp.]